MNETVESLRKKINDFTDAEAAKLQAWLDHFQKVGVVTLDQVKAILQPAVSNLTALGNTQATPVPVTPVPTPKPPAA